MYFMSENSKSGIFEKFVPMLLLVTVALAFLVGILWQKVNNLSGSTATNTGTNVAAGDAAAPAQVNGKLTEDQAKNVPALSDSDYVKGNKNADLVMIEYSDLECPFCQRFHPTAQQAMDEYGDKIAWAYRHYPLETIHPRAIPSALASECVGKQAGSEGFWKFVDTVFSDQAKYLTDAGLKEAATLSGATAAAYDTCVTGKEFESKIREAITTGTTAGVTGTPATFLMNKKGEIWLVPGAVPYESLKSTIEEALNS